MGIDIDVYYLSKKYFEVEYERSTFVLKGKTYTVPSNFHIILKHPIPFTEFKETFKGFYYDFNNDKEYNDDEMVHDFWIYSNNYTEAYKRKTGKTTLLLPSIKMKKGWLIKYDIMSNDGSSRKDFHYIEKTIHDFESDAEYYYITTYN